MEGELGDCNLSVLGRDKMREGNPPLFGRRSCVIGRVYLI